jgi:hypothetical protein
MAETDHIHKTLDYYRKLREKKIAEIKPALDEIRGYELVIRTMAANLKEPIDIEPLTIEPNGSAATATPTSTSALQPTGAAALRPDEFFQMSQTEAAKTYLRMVGHAVSLDELVNALRSGGAKVGGIAPQRTLYVALKANAKKEFVWPGKDHIGLPEFYQRKK